MDKKALFHHKYLQGLTRTSLKDTLGFPRTHFALYSLSSLCEYNESINCTVICTVNEINVPVSVYVV